MTVSPQDAPRPPSLLRAVIPITLFMLLCGIVGPIFLIMGLAIDEPGTGWLLPTGIAITVLDLAIGVLIGRARYRSQQKVYRLRQAGRPAQAQVLSFEQTGVEINGEPLIALKLRIHGNDIAPFEVDSKKIVPSMRMPLLYAGDLPVLVDPESKEWEIDWASARAVPPATAVTAPAEPVDTRTAGERLAELDDLLKRDLVSRDEYDATRARIIAEL